MRTSLLKVYKVTLNPLYAAKELQSYTEHSQEGAAVLCLLSFSTFGFAFFVIFISAAVYFSNVCVLINITFIMQNWYLAPYSLFGDLAKLKRNMYCG